MANILVLAVIVLIVGAASLYIVKEKKKGVKCIGCPSAGTCSSGRQQKETASCGGGCAGCSGYQCHTEV